jgi:hypothetical protein
MMSVQTEKQSSVEGIDPGELTRSLFSLLTKTATQTVQTNTAQSKSQFLSQSVAPILIYMFSIYPKFQAEYFGCSPRRDILYSGVSDCRFLPI